MLNADVTWRPVLNSASLDLWLLTYVLKVAAGQNGEEGGPSVSAVVDSRPFILPRMAGCNGMSRLVGMKRA